MDPDVILYVDRCCLHYLDTRVKAFKNFFSKMYDLLTEVNKNTL